jgi:hypothetical protein
MMQNSQMAMMDDYGGFYFAINNSFVYFFLAAAGRFAICSLNDGMILLGSDTNASVKDTRWNVDSTFLLLIQSSHLVQWLLQQM